MFKNPEITPAERNRVRRIRDLLDEYEAHLSPNALQHLGFAVEDLQTRGVEAHNERVRVRNERVSDSLREFAEAQR